jgi:hypothetical protein
MRLVVTMFSMICALPAVGQMRAFSGATIIDGNGGKPIANGVVRDRFCASQAEHQGGRATMSTDLRH